MATIYKRSVKQFKDIKIDKNRVMPNAVLPDEENKSGDNSFDSVGDSVPKVRESECSIRKHDADSPSVSDNVEAEGEINPVDDSKQGKIVGKKVNDKSDSNSYRAKSKKIHAYAYKAEVNNKQMTSGEIPIADVTNPITDEEQAEIEKAEEKKKAFSNSRKKTRAEGKEFEEAIIRACKYYEQEGRAYISKVPEPRRVVGRTGGRTSMMICVNDSKAHPDFMGSVAPSGKCFVMEAKHSSKQPITSQRVSEHQVEILEKHMECGADSYVVIGYSRETENNISFDFGNDCGIAFLLPMEVWLNMSDYIGRKSIYLKDCLPSSKLYKYRVPYVYDADGNEIVYFLDKFVG